jgi:hypothetical protein
VLVSAGESTQVGAIAGPLAGNEEAHGLSGLSPGLTGATAGHDQCAEEEGGILRGYSIDIH